MERAIDLDLTTNTENRIDQVTQPTESELQEFRGRIAKVLDRSMTIDRTSVLLPDDLDGYWCPDDKLSIAAAEQRGFRLDEQYAKRNGLNDQANGKTLIGDVFHMVRPKWMKKEEDKARAKQYHEHHLSDRRKQKEEKDFLLSNELPPIVNSSSETITGPQIQESLVPKKE